MRSVVCHYDMFVELSSVCFQPKARDPQAMHVYPTMDCMHGFDKLLDALGGGGRGQGIIEKVSGRQASQKAPKPDIRGEPMRVAIKPCHSQCS